MKNYTLDREKIRTLKFGKRLTNEVMAKKLGISRNQYGKKEMGIVGFKEEEICNIAKALEVEPGFLFTQSVSV